VCSSCFTGNGLEIQTGSGDCRPALEEYDFAAAANAEWSRARREK
jgi:hypothetical protein